VATGIAISTVVAKCLKKDPDERWQSAQDLKTELQWVADRGSQAGVPTHVAQHGKNRELAWALAAVVFFVAAAALAHFRERSRQVQAVRFTVSPPEKSSFDAALALSPDGTRLALVVMSDGKQSLWIRRLDSVTAQPLTGTNGADYPFWSPDGKFVAFFANRKLMKIEAAGGPTTSLCDAPDGRTGAWNHDGVNAFSCGSHHPATGLRGPPYRTTIPRPPSPGPLRPTEGSLDPPPRPQIGQTWGPSLFAKRRRWFPEGPIRELIETGRRVYFRKNPFWRLICRQGRKSACRGPLY